MKVHEARAIWKGDITSGEGKLTTGSGVLEGAYDFGSRFEKGSMTTPEELIGAAHAGCYSMALSKTLTDDGHQPKSVETRAEVRLRGPEDGQPSIERIRLITKVDVDGIDTERFRVHAEAAKQNCVVSRALSGTKIELDASLQSE